MPELEVNTINNHPSRESLLLSLSSVVVFLVMASFGAPIYLLIAWSLLALVVLGGASFVMAPDRNLAAGVWLTACMLAIAILLRTGARFALIAAWLPTLSAVMVIAAALYLRFLAPKEGPREFHSGSYVLASIALGIVPKIYADLSE